MSLREPVELLDPSAVGPVYFIAIGGAGTVSYTHL